MTNQYTPRRHPIDPTYAVISPRGAQRWVSGHPWIYRSDVTQRPSVDAGVVKVVEANGRPVGQALWSPPSEISLRLLDSDPDAKIDGAWWRNAIETAIRRRTALGDSTTACRLVYAESDGLPGLIVDRYDTVLVVQLLTAGIERARAEIVEALRTLTNGTGILARNDVAVRRKEGLPENVELLWGEVPREVEVREGTVRYLAAPWDGQKTGAFLDQRENRMLIGDMARGRALDCFTYHGSFALHLAQHATSVIALDSSTAALERGRRNAALNTGAPIDFVEADAFAYLREAERTRERFDTIVLDPPAFAKTRQVLGEALRGYKEINLRAMRLLNPGGVLYTASCSFHMSLPQFMETVASAARDSGRRLTIRRIVGLSSDHPEVLTIPETQYLKGVLIEAVT